VENIGEKDLDQETNTPEREKKPRNSAPTPVARGGSGAEAPPLAARPNGSPRSSEKCFPRRNWKPKDHVWLQSLFCLPPLSLILQSAVRD